MRAKRHTPEQIIRKLREAEVMPADFRPPEREIPAGIALRPARGLAEIGAVNDAAYDLEGAWGAALITEPSVEARWLVAAEGDRAIACAGAIDAGDDVCVTAVATLPARRGGGSRLAADRRAAHGRRRAPAR